IFLPRDTFLDIINSMMQRKRFSINAQNELQITTQSGKNLPINRLSSGEKQLLIVLGEALLQEKKSWVYIADEPELSLHVKWQESLVGNLRAINPNAQIIFATHSPDVVSVFGNKVFDMENMF
ncbi:ATP-binding protein, partial [Vibrio parahaemolyticus]|nr:ATP-binding protein [Vibrio parahaemolyticus]